MCVALPCKLIEIDGNRGVGEIGGAQVRMRLDLLSGVEVGDYVLVHAGFAIEKVDEEEAHKTLSMLDDVGWWC